MGVDIKYDEGPDSTVIVLSFKQARRPCRAAQPCAPRRRAHLPSRLLATLGLFWRPPARDTYCTAGAPRLASCAAATVSSVGYYRGGKAPLANKKRAKQNEYYVAVEHIFVSLFSASKSHATLACKTKCNASLHSASRCSHHRPVKEASCATIGVLQEKSPFANERPHLGSHFSHFPGQVRPLLEHITAVA